MCMHRRSFSELRQMRTTIPAWRYLELSCKLSNYKDLQKAQESYFYTFCRRGALVKPGAFCIAWQCMCSLISMICGIVLIANFTVLLTCCDVSAVFIGFTLYPWTEFNNGTEDWCLPS